MAESRAHQALSSRMVITPIVILIVCFMLAGMTPGVVVGAIISIAYVLYALRHADG